jgi:hypothetical protein
MHSAIRSPTLNPIGAIGLRATDDDLPDRSGRAEFDPLYQPRPWPEGCVVVAQQIEIRARIVRVLHSAGYGAELAIGHVRVDLIARYNKDEAWDGRRDAFTRVSDHVASFIGARAGAAVIPLRG